MDEDHLLDDVVGTFIFDVKELISNYEADKQARREKIQGYQPKNGQTFWKNIYGSHMDLSNSKYKNEQNDNPQTASNWKGRVLMQVICEETENPECKVEYIPKEIVDVEGRVEKRYFDVIAEVGQAIALPDSKPYKVKFLIGGKSIETNLPQHQAHNYCRFNERIEQQTLQVPYRNTSEFGSLIILLMDDKNQPVCFYKDSISNYTNPNPEYKWI